MLDNYQRHADAKAGQHHAELKKTVWSTIQNSLLHEFIDM